MFPAPPAAWRSCFPLPAFLLCAVFLLALAGPAPARQGDIVMYYRSYPDENLDDVVRKLDTSAGVVRRLNKGRIGANGELAPYTLLAIPTTPAHEGSISGAKAPPPPKQSAPKTAPPARPAPSPPAPASAPAPPAGKISPVTTPRPQTYDTRDAGGDRSAAPAAPSLWLSLARLLAATVFILALVYAFIHLVKRFGWEAPLARWGGRLGPAPAGRREDGNPPSAPAVETAPVAGDFGAHLRLAANKGPGDAVDAAGENTPSEEKSPSTLLGNVRQADTNTRIKAAETNPDDDDIPETSLQDALRGRRNGG